MKRVLLLLCAVVLLSPLSAFANNIGEICYKYQKKDYSWSKAYKLTAQVVTGQEMVKATSNYTKYSSIYNYVIIQWNNGGYSALKVNSWEDSYSSLPSYYTNTKDQNGNTVKYMRGSYCY
ncbi:hypothetical protein [Vibrio crassostreae]|uniref:hypothetical protein n=1 Tax=Vibrio crassostreae TaxID=246167 RepID=UPI000630006B|nr:hypothetical protein [Vibrio crassostreae]TCN96145.1 hypothetical protein EDB30_11837 [Vibrio crassostreae]CAK1814663.1 conserved exported hypothetical protein [Vibrio crassostreae]CAK1815657.1 conserved exported hypothetical protein [Vibrio crassostreae]CAK1816419.1 conserved exported hypothetical protein [Vibrio crassostreae]CAK1997763.1 conserved exported hypothetical protein [Vibrio crassostreae]